MIVVGLTGGIASGKSTVARALGERGAYVIDADVLGHRAYEPGTQAHREVQEAFGPEVVAADGSIDRKALGATVFGKPEALDRLTGIVWPEIRRLAQAEIDGCTAKIVVLEAAVLLEAGWQDLVDEVWVVVVDPEVAVERAVARGGLDAEAVRSRLAAQLSNDERKAHATRVIDNGGDRSGPAPPPRRSLARTGGADVILDLHTHSIQSDDGRAKVENYCQWIRKKEVGIDGFVLTEHRQFGRHLRLRPPGAGVRHHHPEGKRGRDRVRPRARLRRDRTADPRLRLRRHPAPPRPGAGGERAPRRRRRPLPPRAHPGGHVRPRRRPRRARGRAHRRDPQRAGAAAARTKPPRPWLPSRAGRARGAATRTS